MISRVTLFALVSINFRDSLKIQVASWLIRLFSYKYYWHVWRKPNTIFCLEKFEALFMHKQGFELQYHRFAMSLANCARGFFVLR
jgi:hypothetical protein